MFHMMLEVLLILIYHNQNVIAKSLKRRPNYNICETIHI
jgi:hypothetical protein